MAIQLTPPTGPVGIPQLTQAALGYIRQNPNTAVVHRANTTDIRRHLARYPVGSCEWQHQLSERLDAIEREHAGAPLASERQIETIINEVHTKGLALTRFKHVSKFLTKDLHKKISTKWNDTHRLDEINDDALIEIALRHLGDPLNHFRSVTDYVLESILQRYYTSQSDPERNNKIKAALNRLVSVDPLRFSSELGELYYLGYFESQEPTTATDGQPAESIADKQSRIIAKLLKGGQSDGRVIPMLLTMLDRYPDKFQESHMGLLVGLVEKFPSLQIIWNKLKTKRDLLNAALVNCLDNEGRAIPGRSDVKRDILKILTAHKVQKKDAVKEKKRRIKIIEHAKKLVKERPEPQRQQIAAIVETRTTVKPTLRSRAKKALTWIREAFWLPSKKEISGDEGNDYFVKVQSTEQAVVYGGGGPVEAVGKFFQRTCQSDEVREQYLHHPAGEGFFRPLYNAFREHFSGLNEDNFRAQMKVIGKDLGQGWGNVIKIAGEFISMLRYNSLSKRIKDKETAEKVSRKATSKITGFNAWRTAFYLVEKLLLINGKNLVGYSNFMLIGLSCAETGLGLCIASHAAAVGGALFSYQALIPKINQEVIYKPKENKERKKAGLPETPVDLIGVRDSFKQLGISLSKGLWSLITLGATAYVSAASDMPEKLARLSDLGIKISDGAKFSDTTMGLFDFVVQANWEQPSSIIIGGAVLMSIGPILSIYTSLKEGRFLESLKRKKKENASGKGVDERTGPRRTWLYWTAGFLSDAANFVGGIGNAFLKWQPLGAIYNAGGAVLSTLQLIYSNQLNKKAKEEQQRLKEA